MLRIIFYAVIVVLILSFFGVSLQAIVHSPAGESNFSYLWELIASGFHFVITVIVGIINGFVHLFVH